MGFVNRSCFGSIISIAGRSPCGKSRIVDRRRKVVRSGFVSGSRNTSVDIVGSTIKYDYSSAGAASAGAASAGAASAGAALAGAAFTAGGAAL